MVRRVLTISFVVFVSACAGQSQPQIAAETPSCKPDGKDSKNKSLALDGDETVTFYGDLLPILSSNVDGKVYKCTTCHADMKEPSSLNSLTKVNRAIDSMENGRMPRPGNLVPKDKIELFRIWQLQGFHEGDKNNPRPSALSRSTEPASNGSGGSAANTPASSTGCP